MPRFFFFVYNGHGETPDETGTDLRDKAAARQLALDSVRSMVAEEARSGVIDLTGHIEVKDQAGQLLLTVDYVEAFNLNIPDGRGQSRA